jgi:hypothetical protein
MEVTMPRKPISVSVSGYLALVCVVTFLVGVGIDAAAAKPQVSGEFYGLTMIGFLGTFGWWLLGTMVHRSRLNKMRYK